MADEDLSRLKIEKSKITPGLTRKRGRWWYTGASLALVLLVVLYTTGLQLESHVDNELSASSSTTGNAYVNPG